MTGGLPHAARIEEIRKRAEAATSGPWERYHLYTFKSGANGANIAACGDPWASDEIGYARPDTRSEGLYQAASNAEFIAHARQDIPYLLQHAADLQRENERLREERDDYKHAAWEMSERD